MKTLIVALNSKYIHSALAPWYLKASCGPGCGEVCIAEHTINERHNDVLSAIYLQKPDVVAFSCYIWNISFVLKLAASLKKVLPKLVIILGGPEVSYDSENILKEHQFVDYILAGEGEESFPELLAWLKNSGQLDGGGIDEQCADGRRVIGICPEPAHIKGLSWRSCKGIVVGEPAYIENLDKIPSPYTDEMLLSVKNKIAYFESSRGCPFSCSYCLSSASQGIRVFSLERVFAELDRLAASGVRQIKFVDRTFNANRERAKAIIRYILEMDRPEIDCNFHFEVGGDIFDEETIQLLQSAPKGLFQLEAGVQTVNEETLTAVCRRTNLSKLFQNLSSLKKHNNVHIHADLIAGLPYEDYSSFKNSFNSVYAARPHQLQLGFLKFLKGTRLREEAKELGFEFTDFPPYEVLSGRDISFDELIMLKDIAELVERYYNSGRFIYTLEYVIEACFRSPFDFYEGFASFHKQKGLFESSSGLRQLYETFDCFASDQMDEENKVVFRELLRLDFLASDNSGTLPEFLQRPVSQNFNNQRYDYIRDTDRVAKIIPEAAGMQAKQLLKKVHFEQFLPVLWDAQRGDLSQDFFKGDLSQQGDNSPEGRVTLLFSYISKDKVTGRYKFFRVF
jgi:radical SAM superfamily enzyme YgiQ (UPF0313 family)